MRVFSDLIQVCNVQVSINLCFMNGKLEGTSSL